jgi:hypothetical protein
MFSSQNFAIGMVLFPIAITIAYMDIRYRRIPNRLVLVILIGGITLNSFFGGWQGLAASLGGLAVGFGAMFILQVFCRHWIRNRYIARPQDSSCRSRSGRSACPSKDDLRSTRRHYDVRRSQIFLRPFAWSNSAAFRSS